MSGQEPSIAPSAGDVDGIPSTTPSSMPSAAPILTTACEELSRDVAMTVKLLEISQNVEILLDPDSPQGQAREWLLTEDPAAVDPCTYAPLDQRYALATIYYATQGNEWINATGWLVEVAECDWYQVFCNDGSQLVNLTLVDNGLNGTLPEEIRALTSMEAMDISENYISGTIPASLEELSSSLQIYRCARNDLTGSVPDVLGNMTSLRELVVSIIYAYAISLNGQRKLNYHCCQLNTVLNIGFRQ
jgi:hypothetical protein